MSRRGWIHLWILFAVLTASGYQRLAGQIVVQYPNAARAHARQSSSPDTRGLADRWKGALEEAQKRGFGKGYWIGYSIQKRMPENSFIGSFFSDPQRNKPSLQELLTGSEQVDIALPRTSGNFTVSDGVSFQDDTPGRRRRIMKEIGVLFHFAGLGEADRVKVTNLTLHVDLEGDPLIWVGAAEDLESIALLKSHVAQARSTEVKEQLVRIIGLHEPSPAVLSFLRDVLTGSERSSVREESAFWLGQMNTDEALKVLAKAAETDGSESVREKAVFGISQMEGDRGVDALIKLVRESSKKEIRNKAAFWLGQRASEKAVATLNDIAYSSEDTDLQKSALFALTQLPDGAGVENVIRIAKTHPNPKVRKEAIFWLGQCEDRRAIEALIEMVRQ